MSEEAKKKLLRSIPYGVYVVGVKAGKDLHGFTGSWVSQVSMKPPMIGIGVRHGSHSLEMVQRGKVLALNYFKKTDKDLVSLFFKPPKHEGGRLADCDYHTDKTGAPILDKAIGYLECEVRKIVDGFGDHSLVIAEVINANLIDPDAEPLIMSDTPWHYGG